MHVESRLLGHTGAPFIGKTPDIVSADIDNEARAVGNQFTAVLPYSAYACIECLLATFIANPAVLTEPYCTRSGAKAQQTELLLQTF